MLSYALLVLLSLPGADPVQADIVIKGAEIHDGAGKPGRIGDLAIKGERIVAVGTFEVAGKPKIIEGKGLIVAPGFIDLHTHSDTVIVVAPTNANYNYVVQGVTTIVTGNCGSGPVDVAGYLKKIEKNKAGSNVLHQIPHNDLRRQVMGNANRAPTKEELTKMKDLVEQCMKEGAVGLSTGLYYVPGSYAELDELVELSKVVAKYGGIYASHIRDEGAGLLASITEALEVGKQAGVPVHISHFKAYSPRGWGKAADAIALIEQAQKKGQKVTADQYPYVASSTRLSADLIPTIFREGTQKDLIARLDDPEQGKKIRAAIEANIKDAENGKSIRIAQFAKNKKWQGKDLATIAAEEKKSVLEIVIEIEKLGGAQIVNFSMKEEEVRLIMKRPWVATASDGSSRVPDETLPHPRLYGTFARKIGRYSFEDQVIPPEQAIRSASGLPADIAMLKDRGYLKAGYYADVVVLDPKAYRDTATFDKPHQYATGVKYVFVNGVLAIDDGKDTKALAGQPLRHEPKK